MTLRSEPWPWGRRRAGKLTWRREMWTGTDSSASVAQEYRHGRTESEIDWKTTVSTCAVANTFFYGIMVVRTYENCFTLKQLPTLAFRLAVVVIAAWLIFFSAGENTKDMTPEFSALQQEARSLKEENAKFRLRWRQLNHQVRKRSQDLTNQQNDLGAKSRSTGT